MRDYDLKYLREAFDVARKARTKGNHPFGAILVDDQGNMLIEAENTVVTAGDPTGHAETNLVRLASKTYGRDYLAQCTLYTSTEPCPMCCGAIYWGNVGRVVYGLSQESFYQMFDQTTDEILYLPCRELFRRGNKQIEVIGPYLEDEGKQVHADFWI